MPTKQLHLRTAAKGDETGLPDLGSYESTVADAQKQLEYLHEKKRQIDEQRLELEKLRQRKEDFLNYQVEVAEKISQANQDIDRFVSKMKEELRDLSETRQSFKKGLSRIEKINPEAWSREKQAEHLDAAIEIVAEAEKEFEEAANYFSEGVTNKIFRRASERQSSAPQDFRRNVVNGFAFNLPIIILALLAFVIFS